jgi:hypothetical protein
MPLPELTQELELLKSNQMKIKLFLIMDESILTEHLYWLMDLSKTQISLRV